jgi:hypothetical protein
MPLPYQTVLRLPANANAVAIAEQEAERWLLSKASPGHRELVRSGRVFETGVHRIGRDKTLTVVRADRAEDGSRRLRLRLVEKNPHGEWEASITAVDYPVGNRRRDALIITAAKLGDPQGDWEADPPRLVKDFLAREDVYDGDARVTAEPQISGVDEVDDVLAAITDRARSVSVIVASSLGSEYDAEFRGRLSRLTANVVGVAAVYFVSSDAVQKLNAKLGKAHSVEAGRIRTFLPLVDLLDEADARRHRVLGPATFANAIRGTGVASYLQSAFALETRTALLARPLPSDIRRGIEALDTESNRISHENRIGERVRVRLATPTRTTLELDREAPRLHATDATVTTSPPVPEGQVVAAETRRVRDILHKLANLSSRWLKTDRAMPVTPSAVDELEQYLAVKTATADEWFEAASGLETELSNSIVVAENLRSERDDLDLELSVVEEESARLRRQISHLQTKLVDAHLYDDAYGTPLVEPEWDVPQSLVELATVLQRDSEQRHAAYDLVEFCGDIRLVEDVQKRDPVGRYAGAFWEFVRTLHDYARLKVAGEFAGSVHQYLTSDVAGYKCSPQRHAGTESESVLTNATWRAQRMLPVPTNAYSDGQILMPAHFKATHADTVAPRMHYWDGIDAEGKGKIYIGYIGRHLDNTKTKSS